MFTPTGVLARNIDPIMLMNLWGEHLSSTGQIVIKAGIGAPSFPLHPRITRIANDYWNEIAINGNQAIGYEHPQGKKHYRSMAAEALSVWYGCDILTDHVFFTAGGASSIRIVYEAMTTLHGPHRIIMTKPYYTLYANTTHPIQYIHLMQNSGYQLTAESLEQGILDAMHASETDGLLPRVLVLCEPNNPMGTTLSQAMLLDIKAVLERYPDLTILLDEAYVEMLENPRMHSLYALADPALRARIILFRSGTKGLSLAGERMALLVTSEPHIKMAILSKLIEYLGHASLSSQYMYAHLLQCLIQDPTYLREMSQYYARKLQFSCDKLSDIGASLPDNTYQPYGTFYVCCDLSPLLGLPISSKATQALGKTGTIASDEDIAYTLLFEDGIMIAPLSYYGVFKSQGYCRITCGESELMLAHFLDVIGERLEKARNLG